jgi:hypothetical protein
MNIKISHFVTLFPQPTSMTCWSAAATMLFGDRSVGPGPAATGASGGLGSSFENIQLFASAHGLTMHPPQSWTVAGLADLLRRGPLWVGGMIPSGHAYVIAAIEGDGSPANTKITIYDPWPPKFGRIYTVAYGTWMQQHPMATTYILHR